MKWAVNNCKNTCQLFIQADSRYYYWKLRQGSFCVWRRRQASEGIKQRANWCVPRQLNNCVCFQVGFFAQIMERARARTKRTVRRSEQLGYCWWCALGGITPFHLWTPLTTHELNYKHIRLAAPRERTSARQFKQIAKTTPAKPHLLWLRKTENHHVYGETQRMPAGAFLLLCTMSPFIQTI